ncbi:hypothetical protein VM1G_04422 [Cytospora mali]|uniref:Cyclin N-terminal domain-containing protein n=1 Tax=Cytospora mali TaxID=578113 RepID=A0A194VX22_CYTMA|nr:hypothetical protein VM1G_04422 [Valsa mali]
MAPYNVSVVTPSDIDDEDFDLEYFSRTYKPLSNLPTPPPSSRNSASCSPIIGVDDDADVESTLLGPAVHLVNLHPPSASISSPSVSLVQAMITRADLPLETIALAVCILDSLDSKFSRKWRVSLPLATPLINKRHTITTATSLITHIDSVSPEIIILTALVIAFKFTEDCHEPTQYYASDWGKGLWTCDQINTTERCIMEHLGYRILPLCDKAIIDDALEDMKRAGKMALRERETRQMLGGAAEAARIDISHTRSISVPVRPGGPGDAVFGLGFQMTPIDSPTDEMAMELGTPQ